MLNHASSNCYDHLRSSAFSSSTDEHRYLTFGAQFGVLVLLTLLVICGNTLVILSVLCYKHLRRAGGLLIASLAGADLSVGLFVLPFSAVNQASGGVWPFGSVWCQMWLAIDVWMCTSSIYNLIAIAFDRFVAVTKPLSYRNLITRGRISLIIMSVWLVSFLISLPPMISNWPTAFDQQLVNCTCTPMDNSPAYIIYSSIGSFHFPLIVIIYLYYRIYLTVRSTAHTMEKGYMTVENTSNRPLASLQLQVQLRQENKNGKVKKYQSVKISRFFVSVKSGGEPTTTLVNGKAAFKNSMDSSLNRLAAATPWVSSASNCISSPVSPDHDCGLRIHRGKYAPSKRHSALTASFAAADDTRSTCSLSATMSGGGDVTGAGRLATNGPAMTPRQSGVSLKDSLLRTNLQAVGGVGSGASSPLAADQKFRGRNLLTSPTTLTDDQVAADVAVAVAGSFSRAKDNRARYYRRLHNEIKAVKTVGLVTLCFVCCWLGFSVVYTLQAFCGQQGAAARTKDCVPGALFTVFFWLGYVNSALNPLIYAAYNRQYRLAFGRILSGAAFGRKKRRGYGAASPSSNLEYVASKAANAKMGRSESRGPMCKTPDISISN